MPPMVRATLTVEDFDAVVAAYERLGFSRVKAWNGTGRGRSALFRAGPSYVEVRERTAARERRRRVPAPPRRVLVESEAVTA